MKKYYLFFLLAFAAGCIACSDDDDNKSQTQADPWNSSISLSNGFSYYCKQGSSLDSFVVTSLNPVVLTFFDYSYVPLSSVGKSYCTVNHKAISPDSARKNPEAVLFVLNPDSIIQSGSLAKDSIIAHKVVLTQFRIR